MWWEVPKRLEIKNGRLHIAGRDAALLAEKFGTPLHVYNGDRVAENYKRFYSAVEKYNKGKDIRIHYAMKNNSNKGILEILRDAGAWIDAVSSNEAQAAIDAGFPSEKILFTGSSVSDEEMRKLIDMNVRINIDSPSQLKRLRKILDGRGVDEYEISIRIDPGITGAGHVQDNITTGNVIIYGEEVPTKFGVDSSEIHELIKWAVDNRFKVIGLHFHIGSNWRTKQDIESFLRNLDAMIILAKETVKITGDLEFLDMGGGPGARYREDHEEFPLETYAKETAKRIDASGLKIKSLAFETGRYIAADSGILLARITDIKKKGGRIVAGVDTGFNHLPRPEIYNSYHHATICDKISGREVKVMVAGNICETGDYLTRDPIARNMPIPEEGDIIAFHTTGAYVKAMEMKCYNSRTPAQELLLTEDNPAVLYKERIDGTEEILITTVVV